MFILLDIGMILNVSGMLLNVSKMRQETINLLPKESMKLR